MIRAKDHGSCKHKLFWLKWSFLKRILYKCSISFKSSSSTYCKDSKKLMVLWVQLSLEKLYLKLQCAFAQFSWNSYQLNSCKTCFNMSLLRLSKMRIKYQLFSNQSQVKLALTQNSFCKLHLTWWISVLRIYISKDISSNCFHLPFADCLNPSLENTASNLAPFSRLSSNCLPRKMFVRHYWLNFSKHLFWSLMRKLFVLLL